MTNARPLLFYKTLTCLALGLTAGTIAPNVSANDFGQTVSDFGYNVMDDYSNFYSGPRLLRLGGAYTIGALMANTDIDQNFRDYYQDDVRSGSTDDLAEIVEPFGRSKNMMLVSAVAASTDFILPDNPVGEWGGYATRAYIVGWPATYFAQLATGGSRPGEDEDKQSSWEFWDDSNGVSGHSFTGAVAFLSLGRMNDDKPWLKYSAYAASMLPGLSRINDDKHYLSQVMLGWYMAWEATGAVMEGESKDYALMPVIADDYYGLNLNFRF